jgi:hypothetical protein
MGPTARSVISLWAYALAQAQSRSAMTESSEDKYLSCFMDSSCHKVKYATVTLACLYTKRIQRRHSFSVGQEVDSIGKLFQALFGVGLTV